MATPREHVEEIRRKTFKIGEEEVPETHEMLDQAVKYLSQELYAKDVHFLMELIQNAEDNEYLEGVDPSLEFVITSRDITATGAPATLLLFNNEKGFSPQNIKSICSLGKSTKKGNRKRGYIGEKGIGFKSVFLISSQPHIFSNGYQIRFNEKPCPHCHLGYIVPEWVEENPSLSDIRQIYGSDSTIPTTTIVLPLKIDKVKAVKQQLSTIRSEVLLFLSKIKRLSVREHNEDPACNTVKSISILKETDCRTRKNIDAESYILHLSVEEGSKHEGESSYNYYHVWKQRFPVKQENRIEMRMEVEEWVITLAFHVTRDETATNSPGVYAFLPTEMITNFPFIIQADFVLASSRETILLDNVWNQGILDCVPIAFVNALVSWVTENTIEDAPSSTLLQFFEFLPVNPSSYNQLNVVRESIRATLANKDIVPGESYTGQLSFYKPCKVGRLIPSFWNILLWARIDGVRLHDLSSHGCIILNSSFDKDKYDHILNFLGVGAVSNEWYAKCIQGSNLVARVSEETYLHLLLFLADNWGSKFQSTNMENIPLLKYVVPDGNVYLRSINSARTDGQEVLCRSLDPDHISWLIDWNKKFRCIPKYFFLPKSTQEAIIQCPSKEQLLKWLGDQVHVTSVSVHNYAVCLSNRLIHDRNLVIAYAKFLYLSFLCNYLSMDHVRSLCSNMPLITKYGEVIRQKKVLIPANESKWAVLMVSNHWRNEGYAELSEDYSDPPSFNGGTKSGGLVDFLKTYLPAYDIPDIAPPNAEFPAVSGPLTKQNVFLLLGWIRNQRYKRTHLPAKFLNCIRVGKWLKVTLNGSPGYMPPSQSFLLTSNEKNSKWGDILQNVSVLVDIPLVDQSFYGDDIVKYTEELRAVGVMFEYAEACEFIGKHLMSLAATATLNGRNVISMLNFIKFLGKSYLPAETFISHVKDSRWLRTAHGYKSPVEAVLYGQEWSVAAQISNIPFIDEEYYGKEILSFKRELQLLGVKVDFHESYVVVTDNLKSWFPSTTTLTAEALNLVLDCMRHSASSYKLAEAFKHVKCLKTNLGYRSPVDCFLFDPEWDCLLKVFSCFPLLDFNFYGSVSSYKDELKLLGVRVDFEDAVKAFVPIFRQHAKSLDRDNAFSFLSCYRKLKGTSCKFPPSLKECFRDIKWLRTQLGDYRCPKDCILYSPNWESISQITILPLISDYFYGKEIHLYQKELKQIGVVTEFEAGAEFIPASLFILPDPRCNVTPQNALSLLKCIRILLKREDYNFPKSFWSQVSRKWLKTYAGYRTPDDCCLFDSSWGSVAKLTDGPFIDEEFYGSEIKSYRKELHKMGVVVDVGKVCSLLASHLYSHSDFNAIVRIYNFLKEHRWKPTDEEMYWIWIPDECENGKWVKPGECVCHDKDGLFGGMLNVLDKYYRPELLDFFSMVFGVKSNPSFSEFCKLWRVWESSGHQLTQDECCAFWSCIMKNKSPKTVTSLASDLMKLPVVSGSGQILLMDKRDVFIADDLQLQDLFKKSSPHPLFIWLPQKSMPSLDRNKLLELYRNIGVQNISESVQKEELSLSDDVELKQLNPKDGLIGKGLIHLILGFLANHPSLNMDAKERHGVVEGLINLVVLETDAPIDASYKLELSSEKHLYAKACRMIRWDRAESKLLVQKLDKAGGHEVLIEYATHFSEVIAKGVLWQKEDLIGPLSDLIKFAFLLNFNGDAIMFLMKSKNLQIFMEDEEFLSTAFPSKQASVKYRQ